jgi:DNA repair photolyase
MIEEITAKTILNHVKQPDTWFGLKYNMNLYRGCQHQCIYCDSRSDCYRIEDFAKIQIKINALDLLEDVLPRKRVRGTIGFGSMNDPYMPVEEEYRLTGKSLEIISANEFPVHILTKSDLVLRDIELLKEIGSLYAAVSFTITTADDELAQKLEPGAPLPSQRFQAMRKLAKAGILTGITMMPILPFLEDSEENLLKIISCSKENGATYIIPSFGVSLRPGSREYYYQKLDQHFPGIREKYVKQYGNQYQCNIPNWQKMNVLFREEIKRTNISARIPVYEPKNIIGVTKQIRLFD